MKLWVESKRGIENIDVELNNRRLLMRCCVLSFLYISIQTFLDNIKSLAYLYHLFGVNFQFHELVVFNNRLRFYECRNGFVINLYSHTLCGFLHNNKV